MRLMLGDALDVLPTLEAESVDAVICDLPYGQTSCKWDTVIPFAPMWEQLRRVAKRNAAIVLFAAQPFTSALVMSNVSEFRYTWVWDKRMCTGAIAARYRPPMAHEDIAVFGRGVLTYNPQMVERTEAELKRLSHQSKPTAGRSAHHAHLTTMNRNRYDSRMKHPSTLIRITAVLGTSREKVPHPTQKPVDLLAYLVRTYTNPGEVVLDFCFGSASCGVACLREGREFIGIERDETYFNLGQARMADEQARRAAAQPPLFAAAD